MTCCPITPSPLDIGKVIWIDCCPSGSSLTTSVPIPTIFSVSVCQSQSMVASLISLIGHLLRPQYPASVSGVIFLANVRGDLPLGQRVWTTRMDSEGTRPAMLLAGPVPERSNVKHAPYRNRPLPSG